MEVYELIITIVCSVAASSGFWAFMIRRSDKKDAKTEMLIGLGHDRIVNLGMCYIERGEITTDEYENLIDYLWKPYDKLGGNGSAERTIDEVKKLRIIPSMYKRAARSSNGYYVTKIGKGE